MAKGFMQGDRYYGGLPHASKVQRPAMTAQELADTLEAVARVLQGDPKTDRRMVDITANVAWALKKEDRRRVRELLDKFGDKIAGGPEIIHDIRQWLAANEETMKNLLRHLEEGAGGAAYVKGNLNRTLENVFKAFWEEVAQEVNAQLKKSSLFHAQGDLVATVEPSGFDWPVLVVLRDGEMAYDLEMTLDTGAEEGTLMAIAWNGAMQEGEKVLKVGLHQMAADTAATFLINFIRKDMALAASKVP